MIMTNKLLPVALVAALIGGSVGAVVMHSRNQTTTPTATSSNLTGTDAQAQAYPGSNAQFIPAEYQTGTEQNAYKAGFADGFRQCESSAGTALSAANFQSSSAPRLVSRNSGRYYAHATSSSGGTTYVRPKGRSFWQKHRDKLTVAMGTGGGAIIGGLFGGRKGAAIGALSGAGGSALYTYKIRKRNRRY